MRVAFVGVMAAALAGCGGDACDGYDGRSCIALEVRGAGHLDEVRVSSTELGLEDAISARPGAPTALPVVVPILPPPAFGGPFTLTVRARLVGADVGVGVARGTLQPRQHAHVVAVLGGGSDLAAPADLDDAAAPVEDAGDLAAPALDLAGDLAPLTVGHWHVVLSGGPALNAVWASSPSDVWVVGDQRTVIHLDGKDHVAYESATNDGQPLRTVAALGTQVIIGGPGGVLGRSGTAQWTPLFLSDDVYQLTALDATHAIGLVITSGTLEFYLGTVGGQSSGMSNSTGNSQLYGVWGPSANELYVRAGGALYHSVNGGASYMPETIGSNDTPNAVFGTSSTDVYAANATTIFHSTGNGTWNPQAQLIGAGGILSIGGVAGDLYAVGQDVTDAGTSGGAFIFHSIGDGTWTPEPAPPTEWLGGVWSVAPGEAYAVGNLPDNLGVILHRLP